MNELPKDDFENRPEFVALYEELRALGKKANGDANTNLTTKEIERRDTIWKLLAPPSGGNAN